MENSEWIAIAAVLVSLSAVLISIGVYLWKVGRKVGVQETTLMDHEHQFKRLHKRLDCKVSSKELEDFKDSFNRRLDDINKNVLVVLEILMKK